MSEEEKSIVKGLDFQGGPIASNAVQVDVRSGRIIRISRYTLIGSTSLRNLIPGKLRRVDRLLSQL